MSTKVKIQSMRIATASIVMVVSFVMSYVLYTTGIASLHSNYFAKFMEVDVICNVLSDYGDSPLYDCNDQLGVSALEKKTINKQRKSLSPKDLLTLLAAAKIEDVRDYANPEDILDMEKSGVGSWLASGITQLTTKDEDLVLMDALLNPVFLALNDAEVVPERCIGLPVSGKGEKDKVSNTGGTIFTIAMLTGALSQIQAPDDKSCYTNLYDNQYLAATQLASRITGYMLPKNGQSIKEKGKSKPLQLTPYTYTPLSWSRLYGHARYFPFFYRAEDNFDSPSSIKSAMNQFWMFYDNDEYETDVGLKGVSTKKISVKTLFALVFDTTDEKLPKVDGTGYVFEVVGGNKRTVKMSDTTWYQEDPTQLRDAQNKLIAFFISEINRDPEVKLARFKYQAMYGAIQFLIFFTAFTILLFLICRGVTAKIGSVSPANKKSAFYKTAFVRGNPLHETTEYNDSKSLMDHSIGVLPYMGLFGTVIGILMGLPNAAAAITATGPSANESINELFVQLGLAFSTTGMAVVSVIILESIWVLVQHGETNALRNLKAIQAVTAKKNDEKAAKKLMQDQANLIGAAVAKELGHPDNKAD
jgi:hypothetical protein